MSEKKSEYEMTQEQLASIYFAGKEKQKQLDYPVVIKVVEKPKFYSMMPWLISSVALLVTAFSLFSTKRIFVDIHVVDEHHPYAAGLRSPASAEEARPQPQQDTQSETVLTEKTGEDSRVVVQNFVFEGAAKLKSSKDRSTLTLVNSSIAPFARATFNFETPQNLSGSKFVFYAKGAKGGERLAFALKDRNNVMAFDKGKAYPFPNGLTTQWQKAEITLDEASKQFEERKVSSIRFDFGTKDTENKPGDTLFIKELQIAP